MASTQEASVGRAEMMSLRSHSARERGRRRDHPRHRRNAGLGSNDRRGKACAAKGLGAAKGGAGRPCVTPLFPAGKSRLEWPVRAERGPPSEWDEGWTQTKREEGPRAPRPKARAQPDPREEETGSETDRQMGAQLGCTSAGQMRRTRERTRGSVPSLPRMEW